MELIKDRVAAILLMALAGYVFVEADRFNVASAAFPRMVAAVLGVCALVLLLRTVSLRRGVPAPAAADPMAGEPFFRNPLHFAIFLVSLVGYLLLIPVLGYFAATAVLILVLSLALGFRDYLMLILTTAAFLVLVYGVFIMVFARPLPRGLFF